MEPRRSATTEREVKPPSSRHDVEHGILLVKGRRAGGYMENACTTIFKL
jgi:hypothetical protein